MLIAISERKKYMKYLRALFWMFWGLLTANILKNHANRQNVKLPLYARVTFDILGICVSFLVGYAVIYLISSLI